MSGARDGLSPWTGLEGARRGSGPPGRALIRLVAVVGLPPALAGRRDNGSASRKTCAPVVKPCRRIAGLKGECVVIDGRKFRAVNNRDRGFTRAEAALRVNAAGVDAMPPQISAAISSALSTLPIETTLSSTTRPGVDITP